MDRVFLSQVTDQNLRHGIEFVGHDVQVAVIIQIENGRRSSSQRSQHREFASPVLAVPILLICPGTVHLKPGRNRQTAHSQFLLS